MKHAGPASGATDDSAGRPLHLPGVSAWSLGHRATKSAAFHRVEADSLALAVTKDPSHPSSPSALSDIPFQVPTFSLE